MNRPGEIREILDRADAAYADCEAILARIDSKAPKAVGDWGIVTDLVDVAACVVFAVIGIGGMGMLLFALAKMS